MKAQELPIMLVSKILVLDNLEIMTAKTKFLPATFIYLSKQFLYVKMLTIMSALMLTSVKFKLLNRHLHIRV